MMNKKTEELYFAIDKKTGEIFNTGKYSYGKNKVSWVKLGHLKGIFKTKKIDENNFKIYRISVSEATPMLFKIKD